MTASRIICTGPVDGIVEQLLAPFGKIVITSDSSESSLAPLLNEALAIIVRGDGSVSADTIDAAPHLKVIGRTGVGYNNIDIAAATRRQIPVVYTPGANATAVAEATLGMMIALCKRIVHFDQQLKAGNWESRHGDYVDDLDGATLGLVGFGKIGQVVAQMARAFNMTVLATDPFFSRSAIDELGVQPVSLDQLLAESDFVSLHCPATEENHGMIDATKINQMKRGSYLLNFARGELIESLDILDAALVSGQLSGVGLDVFAPEPPDVSHPIFSRPGCLTSPHALALSKRAMHRVFESMARDMVAVLSDQPPCHVVNPEVLMENQAKTTI